MKNVIEYYEKSYCPGEYQFTALPSDEIYFHLNFTWDGSRFAILSEPKNLEDPDYGYLTWFSAVKVPF